MDISKSRVQKIGRYPTLAKEPSPLVRGLNNELGGELYRENRKIMDFRLLRLFVKRFQALEAARYPSQKAAVELGELNRSLRRYTAFPIIMRSDLARHGWKFEWSRTAKRPQPFLELRLILDIIEVFLAGRIASLKQCETCSRWLFARFPHQRFCQDSCKEEFHRSNEADKERRRKWARANYRTRMILESGSKAAAEFKRKKNLK